MKMLLNSNKWRVGKEEDVVALNYGFPELRGLFDK
jgi:hypothetical protein